MPSDTPTPDEFEYLPEPYPMTPEERAAVLAKHKALHTPQELERMGAEIAQAMETGDFVDAEQLLSELEVIHQRVSGKRE